MYYLTVESGASILFSVSKYGPDSMGQIPLIHMFFPAMVDRCGEICDFFIQCYVSSVFDIFAFLF